MSTVGELLARRDNDYGDVVAAYERRRARPWDAPAELVAAAAQALAVVLPARDVDYAIGHVLDALQRAKACGLRLQIVVVDDGSTDATARLAAGHLAADLVVVLPERHGAAVARNVGTLLADAPTVLYLDADMLLDPDALAEHAARAHDRGVLLGFRHNLAPDELPDALAGRHRPDLQADHRVRWTARPGPLLYSGTQLDAPVRCRPIDDTDQLRALGHAARLYDWDLPRMVVTAMVSAPRQAILDVGGFHPDFGRGWGVEDTHLGAKLIANGCKVLPLRHAVGFHLDPPHAAAMWREKLARWPRNIALYRRLLDDALAKDGEAHLRAITEPLLERCRVLKRA
jgi:GT2 family glycosyltransferase